MTNIVTGKPDASGERDAAEGGKDGWSQTAPDAPGKTYDDWKFNGTGYYVWAMYAEEVLRDKGLWGYARPGGVEEDGRKSLFALYGMITFSLAQRYSRAKTGRELWTCLKDEFGRNDSAGAFRLETELHALRSFNFKTVADYCSRVLELTARLRDCGRVVDKNTEADYLLQGLQPKPYYGQFVSGVRSMKLQHEWTIEMLLTQMAELDIPPRPNRTGPDTRTCHGCGKQGHIKANCPENKKHAMYSLVTWIVDSGASQASPTRERTCQILRRSKKPYGSRMGQIWKY